MQGGKGCCGNSPSGHAYWTIYLNPNLLGCYNPHIPGAGAGVSYTAPYANMTLGAALMGYVAPATTGHTATTATGYPFTINNTAAPLAISTNPPSAPWNVTANTSYSLLGCYSVSASSVLLNGIKTSEAAATPSVMNVDVCYAYCSAQAVASSTTYLYFSLFNGRYEIPLFQKLLPIANRYNP